MTWAEDYICRLVKRIQSVLNCSDDHVEMVDELESLAADVKYAAESIEEKYLNEDF